MISLDSVTKENNKKHNEKWPYIREHQYIILTNGGSGSGKTKTLLNLKKELDKHVIDKIYLYARDLNEPKYEYLIKKRENVGIRYYNDLTAFFEYSNTMDDVYEDIDNYNLKRDKKVLIVFDGIFADIMTNKKFQAIMK